MKNQRGSIGLGMAVLIAVVLACVALIVGSWAFRYFTAETRGVISAEEQIESASSRITSYEHYFDLCASVQGKEAALKSQRSLLEESEGKEAARVRANIAGIDAQRSREIAQYNADARKSYTSARFLGDTLPRELNAQQETTSCKL